MLAARIATSGIFWLNGLLLGVWVVHIPVLQQRTSISTVEVGWLLLVLGICAWVGMQLSGFLCDRIGSHTVISVGLVTMGVAVLGLPLPDNRTELAAVIVVLGFSNGLVDVAQNAQGVLIQQLYRRPVMSSLHAFWSLGGLAASLGSGALLAASVPFFVTVGLAGTFAAVGMVLSRGFLIRSPRPVPRSKADTGNARAPQPWSSRVLLLGTLAFVLMLSEGVAYDWSAVHVRTEVGASEAVAALAFGAFSFTMAIVRLVADRFVAAWGPGRFVQRSASVGALGLVIAALAPGPEIAIAGWAVFGVGLAGCAPQLYSAAGAIDPQRSGTYLSRVVGLGYLGLLAGPAAIGFLTSWVSLSTALLLPVAGCLVAAVCSMRVLSDPEMK